jgi:uncharacterized glyoxalase superfamily protein PhnB
MISNRTMPTAAVMPELVYDDVGEACDWLCRVFGLTERWRAGNHRAQLAVGDCAVALMESRVPGAGEPSDQTEFAPEPDGRPSHGVMVRVPDADGHHARALAEGARILQAPQDLPYGERQYSAVDLGGHRWTFSQSIADLAPEEWGGTSGTASLRGG